MLGRMMVCLCASAGLARAVGAQQGTRLAATLGVGTGSATLACRACTHAGNMGGSTGTLLLTSSPEPHVRVGASLDYWWHARETWERGVWGISVVGFYYPGTVRHGFYIGGGPSYSMMFATVTDSTALQRHGWGLLTEMGFEVQPRATLSFTPYVQYSYAYVGDIFYPKGSGVAWARDWRHAVVSMGLGLTYHAHARR
ncbi:MAG TPA: hypothetical protein VL549_11475 [Gemmatimonadales bacterium]|nr:hypothetical protein [Gemmatimonadales bacterium]